MNKIYSKLLSKELRKFDGNFVINSDTSLIALERFTLSLDVIYGLLSLKYKIFVLNII